MPLQLEVLKRDLERIRLIVVGRLNFEGKYLLSVDWVESTYGATSGREIQEKEKNLRRILAAHGLTEESLIYIRPRVARGKMWYTFFIGIKPEAVLEEAASD